MIALKLLRLPMGLGVLGLIVAGLGPAPFVHGLQSATAPALLTAVVVTAVTTLCAAWRWRLIAGGLGVVLPLPAAIAAYYRSQFLNLVLPGGILGDVHRAVVHGKGAASTGLALRAVAWERATGQAVQAAVAIVLLTVLPSPVQAGMPLVAAAVIVLVIAAAAATRVATNAAGARLRRAARAVASDVQAGPLAPGVGVKVGCASLVIVAGHTAVFVVAARASGLSASVATLLPLALVVQLAASVPLGIAGWGPREAVAAWVFSVAGLGAGAGVAVTTLYGVLALLAVLPGGVLLVVDALRAVAPHRRNRSVAVAALPRLALAAPRQGGDSG